MAKLRENLSCFLNTKDLEGARVAFLFESGYNYVVSLFAIWALGGFAVPLCITHPIQEMLYTVTDSDPSLLVASERFESRVIELAAQVEKESSKKLAVYIVPPHVSGAEDTSVGNLINSPIAQPLRPALMIYTSGTTGRPKASNLASHLTVGGCIRT